ncbi:hypothetical protein JCM10212_000899 [Sporobolomyces blumeae]
MPTYSPYTQQGGALALSTSIKYWDMNAYQSHNVRTPIPGATGSHDPSQDPRLYATLLKRPRIKAVEMNTNTRVVTTVKRARNALYQADLAYRVRSARRLATAEPEQLALKSAHLEVQRREREWRTRYDHTKHECDLLNAAQATLDAKGLKAPDEYFTCPKASCDPIPPMPNLDYLCPTPTLTQGESATARATAKQGAGNLGFADGNDEDKTEPDNDNDK